MKQRGYNFLISGTMDINYYSTKIKKMKTKVLLLLALITLSISCGSEDDGPSQCYTAGLNEIQIAIDAYDSEIIAIRDPDGNWHTHEQCVQQHDVAANYLQSATDFYAIANFANSGCSENEVRELNSRIEAHISELQFDVDVTYDCD